MKTELFLISNKKKIEIGESKIVLILISNRKVPLENKSANSQKD